MADLIKQIGSAVCTFKISTKNHRILVGVYTQRWTIESYVAYLTSLHRVFGSSGNQTIPRHAHCGQISQTRRLWKRCIVCGLSEFAIVITQLKCVVAIALGLTMDGITENLELFFFIFHEWNNPDFDLYLPIFFHSLFFQFSLIMSFAPFSPLCCALVFVIMRLHRCCQHANGTKCPSTKSRAQFLLFRSHGRRLDI